MPDYHLSHTLQFAFGPFDTVAQFKIMNSGISEENFVLFTFPTLPVQIILALIFAEWLTGPQAMRSFLWMYTLKYLYT